MKTYDLRHYTNYGYQEIEVKDGGVEKYWVIGEGQPKQNQNLALVKEAKMVDHGNVYYLKSNGRVENRNRETIAGPPIQKFVSI